MGLILNFNDVRRVGLELAFYAWDIEATNPLLAKKCMDMAEEIGGWRSSMEEYSRVPACHIDIHQGMNPDRVRSYSTVLDKIQTMIDSMGDDAKCNPRVLKVTTALSRCKENLTSAIKSSSDRELFNNPDRDRPYIGP